MNHVLLSQSMTGLMMVAAGGCTRWFELHNTARVNQQAPACPEGWMVGGLETRFSIEFQFLGCEPQWLAELLWLLPTRLAQLLCLLPTY